MMKKKAAAVLLSAFLAAYLMGCGTGQGEAAPAPAAQAAETAEEATADTQAKAQEAEEVQAEAPAEEAAEEAAAPAEEPEAPAEETAEEETAGEEAGDAAVLSVGSLKGPTTLGLLSLMEKHDAGEAEGAYSFTIAAQADELTAGIVSGTIDIALIPANLASVLYNKTEGGIRVLDVNTLGVLYCVTGDESIQGVADLSGKQVLTTGQGTTPEYVLRYLLDAYGVSDCELVFKSEAAEAAAFLAEDPQAVAVLPQPFVTSALAQNEALHTAFSLTDAWDEIGTGRMLTGVTVVRTQVFEENPEAVWTFVDEQAASVEAVNADPAHGGELAEQYGILPKAAVAAKAIPNCQLVCIEGDEMKEALSGYLGVLFDAEPKAVGGSLPDDAFYAAR